MTTCSSPLSQNTIGNTQITLYSRNLLCCTSQRRPIRVSQSFFVHFSWICTLQMSGQDRHFQGIARDIRNFCKNYYFRFLCCVRWYCFWRGLTEKGAPWRGAQPWYHPLQWKLDTPCGLTSDHPSLSLVDWMRLQHFFLNSF